MCTFFALVFCVTPPEPANGVIPADIRGLSRWSIGSNITFKCDRSFILMDQLPLHAKQVEHGVQVLHVNQLVTFCIYLYVCLNVCMSECLSVYSIFWCGIMLFKKQLLNLNNTEQYV